MREMKTAGACVATLDAGLKLEWIVYGAAVLSGLAAGIVGRGSPGLAGCVMYLSLGAVIGATTLHRDIRLWRALIGMALLMPLAVAPTRLLGVAYRELHGTAYHIDAVCQALCVGWITLGAALVSVTVLSRLPTTCNETQSRQIG